MGDELEDRRKLRSIGSWILLIGVYSILSGIVMVPLLFDKTASRLSWIVPLGLLGMIGILLLLRLTSEILEYRRSRSRVD